MPEREIRLREAIGYLNVSSTRSSGVTTSARSAQASSPQRKRMATAATAPSGDWQPNMGLDQIFSGAALKKMTTLGLRSVRDILHNYPRRHEDRRVLPHFGQWEDGARVTVQGRISAKSRRAPKPGMLLLEATIENPHGQKLKCTWFNQAWVERSLKIGQSLVVTGKIKRFGRQFQLSVEYYEEVGNEDSLSIGRIIGVYELSEGISQDFVRSHTYQVLAKTQVPDYLSAQMREQYGVVPLAQAVQGMHFPNDEQELSRAFARLRFDEYLFLELKVLLKEEGVVLGKRFTVDAEQLTRFIQSLPFRLTAAQQRVLDEIIQDMRSEYQMARLVQGDVGSGKTAVAACALYLASQDGYQGALMAPTEILARQHFASIQKYLYPLGVRVGLLIGAMTAKEKQQALLQLSNGEIDVVVGTQALIQEGVEFANLGLAVIDEEHRFGVLQRRALLQSRPDVLVMSATPIPRSLALTQYGDLELSIIDELPPGRSPIRTRLLPEGHRGSAYRFVMEQIDQQRQAYVVTSLIEESESLELQAATQLATDLIQILPRARIGLLHGRMKAAEKDEVMAQFRAREFDILVSTTVIEVGVDVPNATVMVIENAERFGLAQLHQLRGRVGRGSHQSYCVLLMGESSQQTQKRLKVIEQSTDGFEIAEADLKLRGYGELRGTRQSGLPELKLGDLSQDIAIITEARSLAQHILAQDPKLEQAQHRLLRHELQVRSQSNSVREVI